MLHWDFPVKTAGKYRLAMRIAAKEPLIRDLHLPNGKTVALSMERTGGEGREAADWKWVEAPVSMDLSVGENSLEIHFNQGIGALDVIALLPEK